MSQLKYKILANNFVFNKNIDIDLSQVFDFTKDDDINSYSNNQLQKNINPVVDRELKRFKPDPNINNGVDFNYSFTIDGNSSYIVSLFTKTDIMNNNPVFYNSFWILDYYDSPLKESQTKLYTNFYKPERIIDNSILITAIKIPIFNTSNEVNGDQIFIYIPNNYLNTSTNLTTIYLKFRFFNAKTGIIYPFKKGNITNGTENDYYFTISLDNVNKIWYIADVDNTFINYSNTITDNQSNNSNPTIKTDDNSSKGSFINSQGNYQSGSVVDNTAC